MSKLFLEKDKVEEILCVLDAEGCIFPGYELVKMNNKPCLLGIGGFSSVYAMNTFERPESKYVLKVIGFEKHVMTSENFWDTVRLQYLLSEQTSYICRVISARELRVVLDDEGQLCEVTEVEGERWDEDGIRLQFILMERLEDIVCKNRFGKISLLKDELVNEECVIDFAIQIGQALHYAHCNNVLHRDVKLENIFWDSESQCYKLGDFGIAKYAVEGNAETIVYTDGYGAPEIERYLYESYNATADIYSFGITLYLLLNDFRFPGSEGYYVNMVQYSPEFVFPAPAHASEGMVRIIRKMCQYYQDERYQSMAEVLMDLVALKDKKHDAVSEEDDDLPDFETETYKEESNASDASIGGMRRRELTGRAKRKEDERIDNEIYNEYSVWHFIGFTLLLTLLMRGMQSDSSIIFKWQFWIVPITVLIESVLLRVKEFHILFGGIALGIGIYLCTVIGISVPHVIMLIGIATGILVVAGASLVATALWTVLMVTEKMQWLDIISKFDLNWVLLVVVLFMLNHYMMIRIDYNKTTYLRAKVGIFIFDKMYLVMMAIGIILLVLEHFGVIQIPEIVRQIHLIRTGLVSFVLLVAYMSWNGYIDLGEEEQVYENEMDERGDGERSNTTE